MRLTFISELEQKLYARLRAFHVSNESKVNGCIASDVKNWCNGCLRLLLRKRMGSTFMDTRRSLWGCNEENKISIKFYVALYLPNENFLMALFLFLALY